MVFSSLRFSQTSPTDGRLTSVLRRPLGSLALSMSMSSLLEPFGIIGSVGDRSAPRLVDWPGLLTAALPKLLLLEALSCAPNRISLGRGLRGRPLQEQVHG